MTVFSKPSLLSKTSKLLLYVSLCIFGERTAAEIDHDIELDDSIQVCIRKALKVESTSSLVASFDEIREKSLAFPEDILEKNLPPKKLFYKYYKNLRADENLPQYDALPEISDRQFREMPSFIPMCHAILDYEMKSDIVPVLAKQMKKFEIKTPIKHSNLDSHQNDFAKPHPRRRRSSLSIEKPLAVIHERTSQSPTGTYDATGILHLCQEIQAIERSNCRGQTQISLKGSWANPYIRITCKAHGHACPIKNGKTIYMNQGVKIPHVQKNGTMLDQTISNTFVGLVSALHRQGTRGTDITGALSEMNVGVRKTIVPDIMDISCNSIDAIHQQEMDRKDAAMNVCLERDPNFAVDGSADGAWTQGRNASDIFGTCLETKSADTMASAYLNKKKENCTSKALDRIANEKMIDDFHGRGFTFRNYSIDGDHASAKGIIPKLNDQPNSEIKGHLNGDGFHKIKTTNKAAQKLFGGSVKVNVEKPINVTNLNATGIEYLANQLHIDVFFVDEDGAQKKKRKSELSAEIDARLRIDVTLIY